MKTRDPRIDPQPGDIVRKDASSGSPRRIVFKRIGSDIYYSATVEGPERICWLTTWQTWCRDATIILVAPLSVCCRAPCTLVGKTTLHYECTKCKQPCDAKA